jgi:hypothetical protein
MLSLSSGAGQFPVAEGDSRRRMGGRRRGAKSLAADSATGGAGGGSESLAADSGACRSGLLSEAAGRGR